RCLQTASSVWSCGQPSIITRSNLLGGTALAYRPRLRGGVWFIRSRINAHAVSRSIGRADDIEPADGKTVLTYEQALAEVRRVMSGGSDALLCDPPDRASSKYLTCLSDW